jgi:hypothetical protein
MIWTHVSELAIDRMLTGEAAPADTAAYRDHALSCADCKRRLAAALAEQRAFAPPPLPLARRRRFAAPIAAITALAAALAIVWSWPRGEPASGTRTKGTAIVGAFVAHGDHVRRAGLRETVMPGDRVQLFTSTLAATWFAAISDDAAGQRSVYVTARPIEPGRERVLPLSIELDDVLGLETVTGVFCPQRFDAYALDLDAPPTGCTLDRLELVKVPR